MKARVQSVVAALVLVVVSGAWADRVEMLDGSQVEGTVLKGTETEILVEVTADGKTSVDSLPRKTVHAVTVGTARIVINGAGLVGAWDFEAVERGLAPDRSGNDRHAFLRDGATPVPGRNGNACKLDGKAAHVRIPSDPALDNPEAVTFMGWVFPERDAHWHVVDKGDGDKRIYAMGTNWVLSGHVRYLGQHAHADSVDNTLVPDEWQHVAMTWSRQTGSIRLYRNGVEVPYGKRTSGTGAVKDDTSFPYTLGARGALGGVTFLPGMLDDCRIYNRELSPEEILAACKAGNGENKPAE